MPLQGVNPTRTSIGSLSFVGGFHLTSDDVRFGGLSGLDVLDDGNLLAVSDTGSLVWIGLGADGATPVSARLASMRDGEGEPFKRKADADAEGLAVIDGVALVSFENDHRVLAYDLARCGAAARGALVERADLPEAFKRQRMKVSGNAGAEALAITPDGYLFVGVEEKSGAASAVSARAIETAPVFDIGIGHGAPELVGLDVISTGEPGEGLVAYSLHRSTNALATNVIVLVETLFERENGNAGREKVQLRRKASRTLAGMNLFVTIDNFEGIAARRMPDGRVRLYVVADNNFSASQRTLLMVYDVTERG